MSNEDAKRHIPASIKREVRRRCGYGCIFCGCPIYDFDHMVEWSQVHEHKADNITLLCGSCHNKKTNGIISRDAVLRQNEVPFAIHNPQSLTTKWELSSEMPSFLIATNEFLYDLNDSYFAPIVVSHFAPIKFYLENGNLLLDFVAHDSNGKEVMRLVHNEMQLIPEDYDIEVRGANIVIREAPRKIILDVTIKTAQNKVILKHAKIKTGEYSFTITPKNFSVDGEAIQNVGFKNTRFQSISAVAINSPGVQAILGIEL